MKRRILMTAALALAASSLIQSTSAAQNRRPTLHVDPGWDQCSFKLDASLTRSAWRQFTQEAGLVAYFRPLSDARPMGRGKFEISMLQWQTRIDDTDAAWNDTFVHPDSTHWLFEGSGLQFPGFMIRGGVSGSTDVGVYLTKNFGANYGFYGLQLQHNLVHSTTDHWAAAARASFVSLYGPADLNFTVYGIDLLASRTVTVRHRISLSPYAGVSSYLSTSHETTPVVTLGDERVLGAQAMIGAAAQLSAVRLGVEYNVAKVNSISLKVGIGR